VHGKDEALRLLREFIVTFPIPKRPEIDCDANRATASLKQLTAEVRQASISIHDWLRHEFNLSKIGRLLGEPPPRMPLNPAEEFRRLGIQA